MCLRIAIFFDTRIELVPTISIHQTFYFQFFCMHIAYTCVNTRHLNVFLLVR